MSDHQPIDHPYDLLADLLDGGLDEHARDDVHRHLASCAACAADVEVARVGTAALASLPEVSSPSDLLAPALRAFEPAGDDLASRRSRHRRRDRARGGWRLPWPALAGAAAAVAAVVLTASLLFSGGGSRSATTAPVDRGAGGAPGLAESVPSVVDRGVSYSRATVQDLARRLSGLAKASPGLGDFAAAPGTPANVTAPSGPTPRPASVLACLVRGAGLGSERSVYLERATYQGTPAYIGGFVTSSARPAFLLVVVSEADCRFLFEARQPI